MSHPISSIDLRVCWKILQRCASSWAGCYILFLEQLVWDQLWLWPHIVWLMGLSGMASESDRIKTQQDSAAVNVNCGTSLLTAGGLGDKQNLFSSIWFSMNLFWLGRLFSFLFLRIVIQPFIKWVKSFLEVFAQTFFGSLVFTVDDLEENYTSCCCSVLHGNICTDE